MGDDANNPRAGMPGPQPGTPESDPLFWWIGSKQPGDHVRSASPHPFMCRVIENGYFAVPVRPSRKVLWVLVPVTLIALVIAGVIVINVLAMM